MKNQRKTEIKVGVTVFIGIIILIWIFGWAKNISIKAEERILSVRFNSVAGLERGDAVTINGVRKGYVDDLIIEGNSVLVRTILDLNVDLRNDAEFSIMMLDLMGGKKIEVMPGTSSVAISYDEIQNGKFSGDISTAMALLSTVQGDMVTLVNEIKVSLTSLNKIIGDEKFIDNVKSAVVSLKKVTNNLNQLLDENRKGMKTFIETGNELTNNTNNFIKENREVIHQTLQEVKDISLKSNALIEKLNTLTQETLDKENNFGKFLYDENMIHDIKKTLIQVKELTKLLVDQLKGEGINVDAHIF